MISYLVVRCCFHATQYEMNKGLADIKCCCCSHFDVIVAIAQHGILTLCACTRYLIVCHHFHVMLVLHEIWNGSAAERPMDANEVGLIISAWAHPREIR